MTDLKTSLCGVAALGLFAAMAVPAHAQTADGTDPDRGVYLSANVGLAAAKDVSLDYREAGGTFGGTGSSDSLSTKADLGNAVDFGGALGYDFGSIRAEVQADYARNRIKGLQVRSLNGAAVTSLDSADVADFCDYEEIDGCTSSGNRIGFSGPKLRQLSVLANLWYDIPAGEVVTPYVGGGMGVGGFEVQGEGKASFAWQVGAGVAFRVARGVALTADYRYRSIGGTTFTDDGDPDYALRVGKLGTSLISAGVRFTF